MFEVDLADRVDDLICVFEGVNLDKEMDTISMLLTGWVIFAFLSYVLIKIFYIKVIHKRNLVSSKAPTTTTPLLVSASNGHIKVTNGVKSPVQNSPPTNGNICNGSTGQQEKSPKPSLPVFEKVEKNRDLTETEKPLRNEPEMKLKLRSELSRLLPPVPPARQKNKSPSPCPGNDTCLGPDPIVTEFVQCCFEWLAGEKAENQTSWAELQRKLILTLNINLEKIRRPDLHCSVENLEFLENVDMKNLYAESQQLHTIKITCDCTAKIKGNLWIQNKSSSDKKSAEFIVDRIRGRLNLLLDFDEKVVLIKYDGWPEIICGISRKNQDKDQVDRDDIEYLTDALTGSLRNANLEINMKNLKNFPKIPNIFPLDKVKGLLMVRILRGNDIGLGRDCQEPFCVTCLDDPPQKFQTVFYASRNPEWNQSFVFNVLADAGEILFEVYDRVGTRFLGCNIISVEEIEKDQTRILPLKSRRMEVSDNISGSIEVQFKFLEDDEYLEQVMEVQSLAPNKICIKPTKKYDDYPSGSVPYCEVFSNNSDRFPNVLQVKNSNSFNEEKWPNEGQFRISPTSSSASDGKNNFEEQLGINNGQYGHERGRRKTRRGDIFTSIRRRFSKNRSQSALDPRVDSSSGTEDELFIRSISAENNRKKGLLYGASSSARSSASELSALSGQSNQTFIHENSTLVLETIENGIYKYYLVPSHIAEKRSWKKKGKKLHIFGDHSFIATHVQFGSNCEACLNRFSFSFGKQGYQCRDCRMKTHKECHIKVPNCPTSRLCQIEMEFLQDHE